MSSTPLPTDRADLLARLAKPLQYDLAIIGGGATGLGIALDAVLRGLKVVLVDSHDFAKGTSSRSTKLVHGGVRYLAQGNVSLVREALRERSSVLHSTPHLAQPLPFVMPSLRWWDTLFYGAGLKVHDALANKQGLGVTRLLSKAQVLACLPGANEAKLTGGVKYWDGQFDDARLAITLARTAAAAGALLVNYCEVVGFDHVFGRIRGLQCRDTESGRSFAVAAHCVVNATGVWVDGLRRLDDQAVGHTTRPLLAPSQGVHVVVDRKFCPGDHAMLVPKTSDGRVLFAVPWLGKVILGTTDTPRKDVTREPMAMKQEIDFILNESAKYLQLAPSRSDIRSVWVGLRPLVKDANNTNGASKTLSREHTVLVGSTGLVSVTGGKWTTYRAMADDVLHRCQEACLVPQLPASSTSYLRMVGSSSGSELPVPLSDAPGPHLYGSDKTHLGQLPGHDRFVAPNLTEAMVRFAARYEYARTVEDVLARRSRLLFLDAREAAAAAPGVAHILSDELGVPVGIDAFVKLAHQYCGSV